MPGHEGARLDPVVVPDRFVEHPPLSCGGCGRDLSAAGSVPGGESRQVFDVPERVVLGVIEHVVTCRECECGHVSRGSFPAGVEVPTQYGPRIRALGVYLIVFQHLPYDRARQALRDLAGADVSTATLVGWVASAAAGLCDFDERLRELLADSPVCHFEETGARIAGRLGWVHVACTQKLTRYSSYDGDGKRGQAAIDHAGVLPAFRGVAVHDGWAPYRNYIDCEHSLCNIHHLRELQAATEAGHLWPVAMSCLLMVQIRPQHLTAALALHDYAARSANWALTGATGQPLAEQIHAALRQHPDGLTRSQISNMLSHNQPAGEMECPGFDGDRVCRFLILMLVVVSYRTSETTPEGPYTLVAFRVSSAGGGQDGSGWGPFRACHSASCSTGGRLLIELCSRRVLNHATYSMIASSSWLLVRHTRSRISSVLNVSTKLSASALAIAVNCAQSRW